jgi:hypothetical protein
VSYSQVLPAGSIAPGTYTVSGTQGNAVELSASLAVGSPIQIQTPLGPGTTFSITRPITFQWTGGDPGTLVRVAITSTIPGRPSPSIYSYADAASGSLTMAPTCGIVVGNPSPGGPVCLFLLAPSSNAQVTVQVLPARDHVTMLNAPGVTDPVELTWQYTYYFGGLTLTP